MESREHAPDTKKCDIDTAHKQLLKNLEQNRLYSLQEVTTLLHISLPTIRRAIKAGEIQTVRVGRLLRVQASEVKRLSSGQQMLTVQEVADLLHVGVYMVRMLIRQGTIQALRLKKNGPWRISVGEIEKMLKKAPIF